MQTVTVYGKIQSSIPFQIVQAVLKHPNYPDSLGTAVLISSTAEKQQLSAIGLWTLMEQRSSLRTYSYALWLLTGPERAIRPYLNVFRFQWL